MNPEEEIPPEAVPRAYYNQAVWKRVVTILAGPFVNLVIAFFLIFGLALSQGELKPKTVHGQIQFSPRLGAVEAPASATLRAWRHHRRRRRTTRPVDQADLRRDRRPSLRR